MLDDRADVDPLGPREVTVERIDLTDDDQIVAVCARDKSRQRIAIVDLPLPDPPPKGAEWIDAYRRWARGRLAMARRENDVDRDRLRAALPTLGDERRLDMLDDAIDLLPPAKLHALVKPYLDADRLRRDGKKPGTLLADVKAFEQASLDGGSTSQTVRYRDAPPKLAPGAPVSGIEICTRDPPGQRPQRVPEVDMGRECVAAGLSLALVVIGSCGDGGVTRAVAPLSAAPAGAIPGRYLVAFDPGVADPAGLANGIVAAHGGTLLHTYRHALKGFAARLPDAAVAALAARPQVVAIESDQPVFASVLWGLDRIDQRALPLDGSYTASYDGTGVTAYVIDTGIDPTHPDFGGRAAIGVDTVGDSQNGLDCDGHGTHVAGTIGSLTYGVAPNVQLVGVRVLDCSGAGTWADVVAGIDWVAGHAARPAVANLSLGGGGSSIVDQAVESLIGSGVPTAVAAGNEALPGGSRGDACNYSPARVPAAMTIGASDSSDTRPYWSNWGDCVDWFAPGVGITSTYLGGGTATYSGSSMASPHTAGVAAIYLAASPLASSQEITDALRAATTTGVVSSARSVNNDLLYSGMIASPPACGDGACGGGETCATCAADCGACPPPPACTLAGASCTRNADCCSGRCSGTRGQKICR